MANIFSHKKLRGKLADSKAEVVAPDERLA
jgi:hypothetical protein